MADGTAIKAKTAFEAYKEQSDEFTIDHVAEVCMVDASDLEEAIKLYAECESGGISLGVATDQYPQSTQAAIGAAALDCMMGYIDKPGSPANSLPRSAESTVFPTGFFGDSLTSSRRRRTSRIAWATWSTRVWAAGCTATFPPS